LGDDQICFVSILIPIIPNARMVVLPFYLGHELQDHVGLEEMSHPFPLFKSVCRSIISESFSKAAVNNVNLRSFDQPEPGVVIPGREPPNEKARSRTAM